MEMEFVSFAWKAEGGGGARPTPRKTDLRKRSEKKE